MHKNIRFWKPKNILRLREAIFYTDWLKRATFALFWVSWVLNFFKINCLLLTLTLKSNASHWLEHLWRECCIFGIFVLKCLYNNIFQLETCQHVLNYLRENCMNMVSPREATMVRLKERNLRSWMVVDCKKPHFLSVNDELIPHF